MFTSQWDSMGEDHAVGRHGEDLWFYSLQRSPAALALWGRNQKLPDSACNAFSAGIKGWQRSGMLRFGTAHCSHMPVPFQRGQPDQKILFPTPVTKFMFHLHPWQLFSVFIVYPHIYSENNTTCSTEICQENAAHKIISAGRSLEV